jgi:hypothetical protein
VRSRDAGREEQTKQNQRSHTKKCYAGTLVADEFYERHNENRQHLEKQGQRNEKTDLSLAESKRIEKKHKHRAKNK